MKKRRGEMLSRECLSRIRSLLKFHPKGLSITDISRKLNINRNAVSRYLDVLLITVHIEMRSIGTSKVFFPYPAGVYLVTPEFLIQPDRGFRQGCTCSADQ